MLRCTCTLSIGKIILYRSLCVLFNRTHVLSREGCSTCEDLMLGKVVIILEPQLSCQVHFCWFFLKTLHDFLFFRSVYQHIGKRGCNHFNFYLYLRNSFWEKPPTWSVKILGDFCLCCLWISISIKLYSKLD